MENVGVSLEEGGIVRMVPILDCLYIRTSDGVNYESSCSLKTHSSMKWHSNTKTIKILS